MSRHERAALKKFLVAGNPLAVAKYISNTPQLQEHMLEHCEGTSIEAVIENLRSRNKEIVSEVRGFLHEYIDQCDGKLPTNKLSAAVQRTANRSAMAENFANVGPELAASAKSLFRNPIKSLTHLSAGITDAYAGGMSALGARESHREILLSTVFAGTMLSISGTAQAHNNYGDLGPLLDDFNSTSIAEDSGPLEITISGGKVIIDDGYLLSPYLAKQLKDGKKNALELIPVMMESAERNGYSPVLFANQLFKESIQLQDKYVYGPGTSTKSAMGVAQFMEGTGKRYGLMTTADFYNPYKAIPAAARHMSDLLTKYDNDVILALAAYNGSPDAVKEVQIGLGKTDITGQEWIDFMTARQAVEGTAEDRKHAWDVETLDYVLDITGQGWDAKYKQWAIKLQGDNPIEFVENITSENSAIAAINAAAPAPNSPG